jgi:hypothetical protein
MRRAFVLQSRSSSAPADPSRLHVRLVSPQSFPHLWKKLWKFPEIHVMAQLYPEFSRVSAKAKVKNRDKSGFPRGRRA